MTPAVKEQEQLRQRLKNTVMNELQQENLVKYFSPIYFVEYEETLPGELFPHKTRFAFYQENALKDAMQIFEQNADARRIIEKSMYSGKETIIKERCV